MSNLRNDIQTLRGIAIVSVVLFHNFKTIFHNGYLGVDVFFVISGYVVTPIILRIFIDDNDRMLSKTLAYKNTIYFFFKRFSRLAPALSVTLIFFSFTTFLIGPLSEHQRSINQALASLFVVGNYGAWKFSGDYFNSNPNQFVHTWSLSVEEQIYIVLPLILYFLFKFKNLKSINHVKQFFKAAIYISVILGIILYYSSPVLGIDDLSSVFFYSPILRLAQFMLGGLLSFSYIESKTKSNSRNTLDLVSIVLLFTLLFSEIKLIFPLNSLCATFLGLYVIHNNSINSLGKIFIKVFSYVGNISYSLYLVHMPIVVALETFPIFLGINTNVKRIFSLLSTFLLGYILYTYIENKYRNPTYKIGLHKMIKKYLLTFFIIPIAILGIGLAIIQYNYFGLGTRENLPLYAADRINCNLASNRKPCEINLQASNGKTLLIGDSQAGALAQAFISQGVKYDHQIYIWVRPSCRFILPGEINEIRDISLKKSPPGCFEHNRSIVEWLTNNPNVNVVITNAESSSRNEIKANFKSIKTLSQKSKKILFIGSIPRFLNDDNFLSRNQTLLNYKENWPKNLNITKILPSNPYYIRQFNSLNKIGNFQTLDPKEIFCNGQLCTRFSENNWLYFDQTHLSIKGADFLFNRSSKILELFFKN